MVPAEHMQIIQPVFIAIVQLLKKSQIKVYDAKSPYISDVYYKLLLDVLLLCPILSLFRK